MKKILMFIFSLTLLNSCQLGIPLNPYQQEVYVFEGDVYVFEGHPATGPYVLVRNHGVKTVFLEEKDGARISIAPKDTLKVDAEFFKCMVKEYDSIGSRILLKPVYGL